MEFLLNELSLEGQHKSVESFITAVLESTIKVLKEISSFGHLILKKDDIFNAKITKDEKLIDLFRNPPSIQRDEMIRFKMLLEKLTIGPYWEEQIKQGVDVKYTWNSEDIWGSSLAESCERDKVIISFKDSRFKERNLEVIRDDVPIIVENVISKDDVVDLLWCKRKILFEQYLTCRFSFGKLNFTKVLDGAELNDVPFNDQRLFVNTFKKFNNLSWDDIVKDDGFKYKQFKGRLPKFSEDRKTHKFRVSEKCRCHGYRDGDLFFVLMLELDHKLSDEG